MNQRVYAKVGREFEVFATRDNPTKISLKTLVTDTVDLIIYGASGKMQIFVKKLNEKDREPGMELNSWPSNSNFD